MTDPGTMLPAARSEQIFVDSIAPIVLAAGEARDRPTAIVVSAQAGAGKTHLARPLAAGLADDGGAVRIDVDTFKEFYPGYRQLVVADPLAADQHAQGDARRWLDRSLAYLTARRVNIIVEHGLRDREVTEALLHQLDQAGYRIEAALMATPSAVSQLGILERHQVAKERTGAGRFVTKAEHDQRYVHLLTVADWLDADSRLAAVSVYQRDGARVHHTDRDVDAGEARAGSTRRALQETRDRPWTRDESESFLRLHASLAARMDPRWNPALTTARTDAAPLLHPEAGQGPTRSKSAVTYGRYQFVSIAHLDTVRTMLREWPRVAIGIIDTDAGPTSPPHVPERLADYYRVAEANIAAARNPMTPPERLMLWRAAIEAVGIADRVTVSVIPWPDGDPAGFNRRFPPHEFDVVFPAASDAELSFADRAEILRRPISSIQPPLEFHTSTIRESYRTGTDVWRQALAPGTLETFLGMDGPRRLLSLEPSKSQPHSGPGSAAELARQSHPRPVGEILTTDPNSEGGAGGVDEHRTRRTERRRSDPDIER